MDDEVHAPGAPSDRISFLLMEMSMMHKYMSYETQAYHQTIGRMKNEIAELRAQNSELSETTTDLVEKVTNGAHKIIDLQQRVLNLERFAQSQGKAAEEVLGLLDKP
tara:strand:- start:2332 stop:2652 length:321 start_codon:yes stop_codon:yes gene_type:complete